MAPTLLRALFPPLTFSRSDGLTVLAGQRLEAEQAKQKAKGALRYGHTAR